MQSHAKILREVAFRESFLPRLFRLLAAPNNEWPTVRCWTKPSLDRIFKKVIVDAGLSSPNISNLSLLRWMERLGFAATIKAEGATFYLVEIGASQGAEVEPLELMMAYEPVGVICYLSALSLHELTSQLPSHHHVAVRNIDSQSDSFQDTRPNALHSHSDTKNGHAESAFTEDDDKTDNVLGKVVFSYLGIPYHLTRRSARLLPGVQLRSNGPRCNFRITTLEQTLLDTLRKPHNCGGPAVVFESWGEAIASGKLDEDRLMLHLRDMHYPSTTRRLGAMLKHMNYVPGKDLLADLNHAKLEFDRQSPFAKISLLPGIAYSTLDEEWLVNTP